MEIRQTYRKAQDQLSASLKVVCHPKALRARRKSSSRALINSGPPTMAALMVQASRIRVTSSKRVLVRALILEILFSNQCPL